MMDALKKSLRSRASREAPPDFRGASSRRAIDSPHGRLALWHRLPPVLYRRWNFVGAGLRLARLPMNYHQNPSVFPVRAPNKNSPLDIRGERSSPPPRMSTKDEPERIEMLQGTLDLLILRTLLLGPAHGHAIAKAIEFRSDEILQVEQGSLYPALHRLIKRKWICFAVGTSENNRHAKYYPLTPKGRASSTSKPASGTSSLGAIGRILRPAKKENRR